MTKSEAVQVIEGVKKWFQKEAGESIAYRIILDSFKVEEWNNNAYIAPVTFNDLTRRPEWTLSKEATSIVGRINAMQDKMDRYLCPLRSMVYIKHEDGLYFLILGSDHVDVIRRSKEINDCLRNVTLSFDGTESSDEDLPRFNKGKHFEVSATSPLKGFVYLYSIDAARIITPIYPKEGELSELEISQNSKRNLSDETNELIKKASPYKKEKPVRFSGEATGKERVVAVVLSEQVSMTIAHLKSRIPLPLLFSHEQKSKGIGEGQTDSTNDFDSLRLDQIAIGTLDYFYEG